MNNNKTENKNVFVLDLHEKDVTTLVYEKIHLNQLKLNYKYYFVFFFCFRSPAEGICLCACARSLTKNTYFNKIMGFLFFVYLPTFYDDRNSRRFPVRYGEQCVSFRELCVRSIYICVTLHYITK